MRNFASSQPNRIWVGDITYVPTGQGWLYVAIIKDLCLKKVIGYATSNRIDSDLVINALDMAVRRQKPLSGCIFTPIEGYSTLQRLIATQS